MELNHGHGSRTAANPYHAFEQVTTGALSSEQTQACKRAGKAQAGNQPPCLPRLCAVDTLHNCTQGS